MAKQTVEPKAYTREQFGQAYSRSLSQVKNLIKNGDVQARKEGASTLIDVNEAERWFASLPILEPTPKGDAS